DAVLVAVAAEAVVGVLQAGVQVGLVGEVDDASDVGGGAPAAFVAGVAVARCPLDAAAGGPVLGEFATARGVDAEFVVLAAVAGEIAGLHLAVEDFALPPDRTVGEFGAAAKVGPGDPGGAAVAVLPGGDGKPRGAGEGGVDLGFDAAEEETVVEEGLL